MKGFSLEKGELPGKWAKLLAHKKVFLSFSGGPDSCALFLLLLKWRKICPFTLEAIHFNHHLRGEEAFKDALFTKEFAEEREIPYRCIDLFVPEEKREKEGEEEAARRLRLMQWKCLCRQEPDSLIASGHQKEDTFENFFLRLARGGNTSSLTAMRAFSTLGELNFFRPLLTFSKRELEEFLRKEGVTKWCIDRTNLDETYCRRNFFRNHLFPLLEKEIPNFAGGLEKTLSALFLDAEFLEETAKNAFSALSTPPLAKEFLPLPDAVSFRVLRLFLMKEMGEAGGVLPDFHSWRRFKEALVKGVKEAPGRENDYRIPLSGIRGKELAIVRGEVRILPEKGTVPPLFSPLVITEEELKEGKKMEAGYGDFLFTFQLYTRKEWELLPEEEKRLSGRERAFFDGDLLTFPLMISPRQEGEKMIPFSRHAPVPLKKLFNEYKIPPEERASYPLFRDGTGAVLMLPLIRRSSSALLRDETERILSFSCRRLASSEK